MSTIIWIVILIVALAAGIGAGYFIGYNNRKKTAEAQIGSAEAEATRLVNEAIKTAEQKRKEAVLEAKDEAFKLKAEVDAQKAEADKEIKQRRAEISRQENRIDQKETALDRKTEVLEKKEEELKKRAAEAEERLAEIDALRAKEMERLETLAGLSQEDAREVLLHKVDEELTHEKAVRVAAYETDLKENCDNIARNLIGQAVSRCAADHCSETTVSVVPLPSDEMKGRIIGREGRNIRALETATGVDLIIDDTPPRGGPHDAGTPDRRWPHPPRPHRGDGGKVPPRAGAADEARGRARRDGAGHPWPTPGPHQADRPVEVPHQLWPERPDPQHGGGMGGRSAGRRDGCERDHGTPCRSAA